MSSARSTMSEDMLTREAQVKILELKNRIKRLQVSASDLAALAADVAALDVQLQALDAANSQDMTVGSPAGGLAIAPGQIATIAAATASNAGHMTAAYATKVDGIAAGATLNTASSSTPAAVAAAGAVGIATPYAREDHVHAHGNQLGGALHADAGAASGFMSAAQSTKLAGIAAGATAEVDADATHAGRVTIGAQTLGSGTKTMDNVVSSGTLDVAGGATFTASVVHNRSSADNPVAFARNALDSGYSALAFQDEGSVLKGWIGYGNGTVTAAALRDKLMLHAATGVDIVWDVNGTVKMTLIASSGVVNFVNTPTANSVDILSQTNTVSSITNKNFTSPSMSGAALTGATTIGTGATFTNPTINAAACSGTFTGAVSWSGTQTFTGFTNYSQGQKWAVRTVTATPATMGVADNYVYCDTATAGATAYNLQGVSAVGGGRSITIVNVGTAAVTINRSGSDTINWTGNIGATSYVLTNKGDYVTLQCKSTAGAEWWKVGG